MANREEITVIKLGGHAMDDPGLLAAFCADIASLTAKGQKFVIVHGGGPHINALLKRLNLESRFIDGLRVTDAGALDAVEMALCGVVNKSLVRKLASYGVNAVGISGQDGGLLRAMQKNPVLGFVGDITEVNPALLFTLLAGGFVALVAPLALGPDGQLLNINADTAAGAIAASIGANNFLLISDVPGVLDGNGNLITELDVEEIVNYKEQGIISGGMLPKLECCQHALANGCKSAVILDGKFPNSLSLCLEGGEVAGTIVKSQDCSKRC